MTLKEFDKYSFSIHTTFKYKEKRYELASVDFQERLIAFIFDEELCWVRCESITNIGQKSP